MPKTITAIMVEDEEQVCREFTECFAGTEGIELLMTTGSATKALEYIASHKPDAVILDLELHYGEGNGITFLTQLNQMNPQPFPYVLINTNNSSQTTYEIVRSLGADMVMYKHQKGYSPAEVAAVLLAFRATKDTPVQPSGTTSTSELDDHKHLMNRIYELLDSVSISPKMVGYQYLAEAIEMFVQGPVSNVSAIIGERHKKTPSSVERAMQNAINRGWDNTDIRDLSRNYTARIHSKKGVPTLMEFICHFANQIRNQD